MSKTIQEIEDFVFSLEPNEFTILQDYVDKRIDSDTFGYNSFEEAALHYGRKPYCPSCGSFKYHSDGFTAAHHKRFRCDDCDKSYTLLSSSVFNSAKLPFHKLIKYIDLMSFNVPLVLCCEVVGIASNTAELWRKKIFATVNDYQKHLLLKDRVWIDETYVEDYSLSPIMNDKHSRGLSHRKICIVVAIDTHKNMVAIISGHGKPSSKRIIKALHSHIQKGSTIVHDGDHSHYQLIEELNCDSVIYKSTDKSKEAQTNMSMINNMCGWVKRYLWRFIGMDLDNLQSYLNWFIYLQRVKRDKEKWPKSERILRHLVLSNAKRTRK